MNRFLVILIIVFIVLFIGKQSNVIETAQVHDGRFGATKEEYRVNLKNVQEYFIGIWETLRGVPAKAQTFFPQKQSTTSPY